MKRIFVNVKHCKITPTDANNQGTIVIDKKKMQNPRKAKIIKLMTMEQMLK